VDASPIEPQDARQYSLTEKQNKTCGSCARWKVPDSGCPYAEDIRQGTLRKSDSACDSYFEQTKAKEKPRKKLFKDSGVLESGCFEAVLVDGNPCFLIKNSENFSMVESVEVSDETFYPKEPKHVPYELYGYYQGSVPNREELYWKVRTEFDLFIDVEPIWKDVLTACVLLTYHQEKLQTVPYLFLYGDNESGKSTVLQVLNFLSYRPMYGVSVPSADVYGYLETSDSIGCILEDEIQGIHKDLDKTKIYKSGYKKGAKVPRTLLTENERIIKFYHTFCFKACASEQISPIKGFNERFLFIPMVEGFPQKEWADITKDDMARLHDLRNMLLKWRMLARDWELPEVTLGMKGRIKELWKPILQVTHGLTAYDGLFKFVDAQRTERMSTKQNTLEGHIVKVVTDIYSEAKDTVDFIPFKTIWDELRLDLNGLIDDRKPNVMDTSEFFSVTRSKLGYRLREVLSGKTEVHREKDAEGDWSSSKVYVFDYEKLKRIAKKYGYELVTKLQCLPSSEGVKTPESMDSGQVKNVEKSIETPQELGKVSNSVTDNSNITIQEIIEKVAPQLTEVFPEERLLKQIIGLGFSREEAQKRIDHFKQKEIISKDDVGNWYFVR
jgi:hypothetical protein